MYRTKSYSRRDFTLLTRNLLALGGLSCLVPKVLASSTPKFRVGHFNNATPQTYEKISGSLAAALSNRADVSFHSMQSAPEFISAMVSGALDTCSIASSPFITTVANQLDLSLVYIQRMITSSEGLVVTQRSGISTAAELKGKKIGVPFNTSSHLSLLATLKKANVSTSDVTLLNLKPDALASAWASRSLDAAYVWYPVLGQLANDEGEVISTVGDLKDQGFVMFDGIIVTNEFKAKHPDILLDYLRDFDRAATLYTDQRQHLVRTFSDYLHLKPELTQQYVDTFQRIAPQDMVKSNWLGVPGAAESGVIRSLRIQAGYLREAGQINTDNLDFTSYIDSSFVSQIATEAV